MDFGVLITDFSGAFRREYFLPDEASPDVPSGCNFEVLDFTSLEGVKSYCDAASAVEISRRISPFCFPSEKWREYPIHIIDTGEYHYLSKLFTDSVDIPYTLLMFDNHTDLQEPAFGGILSCGGWLRETMLTSRTLQKVLLAGPEGRIALYARRPELASSPGVSPASEPASSAHPATLGVPSVTPSDPSVTSGVPSVIPSVPSVIPSAPSVIPSAPSVIPSGAKESLPPGIFPPGVGEFVLVAEAPLTADGLEQICGNDLGDALYISIDKDIMSSESYLTDWSQGTLSLAELKSILFTILHPLFGGDTLSASVANGLAAIGASTTNRSAPSGCPTTPAATDAPAGADSASPSTSASGPTTRLLGIDICGGLSPQHPTLTCDASLNRRTDLALLSALLLS